MYLWDWQSARHRNHQRSTQARGKKRVFWPNLLSLSLSQKICHHPLLQVYHSSKCLHLYFLPISLTTQVWGELSLNSRVRGQKEIVDAQTTASPVMHAQRHPSVSLLRHNAREGKREKKTTTGDNMPTQINQQQSKGMTGMKFWNSIKKKG